LGSVQHRGAGEGAGGEDGGRRLGVLSGSGHRLRLGRSQRLFEDNPDVLKKIISAWAPANDFLVTKPDEALKILQESYYSEVPLSDLTEQYKAEKVFTSAEWRKLYADGTVTKWLNQVSDFFVETAGISSPVMADEYFAPDLYMDVIKA
jgi:NitT/TauT family transport system substrate-binding protein